MILRISFFHIEVFARVKDIACLVMPCEFLRSEDVKRNAPLMQASIINKH